MKTTLNNAKIPLKIMVICATITLLFLTSCKEEPTVITDPVTNITVEDATGNGKVLDDGNSEISARGMCWSTNSSPRLNNCLNLTTESGSIGTFTSHISGLSAGQIYYVRAYATNAEGTGYGDDVQFTTRMYAVANTNPASSIGLNSATLNGTVNPNNESTTVTFEYGKTTSYGSTVTANQSPATGNASVAVSAEINGLQEGTEYHFRVKAINSLGDKTGNDQSFNTKKCPSVTTNPAVEVGFYTATLRGLINPNGESTTVKFEYGKTTSYGSSVTVSQSPVSGTTETAVTAALSGLSAGQEYHFRIVANNDLCTVNGLDEKFTTVSKLAYDGSGNAYNVISIGTHFWLQKNLMTTKLNDGTNIPLVTDATAWSDLGNYGYCWYNNAEATYKNTYGALYNGYAVTSGKLCPIGFHVPSAAEWDILTAPLGGSDVAGGQLKSTSYWQSPNTGATNTVSFSALPGGRRSSFGTFAHIGYNGSWWTSSTVLGSCMINPITGIIKCITNIVYQQMYYDSSACDQTWPDLNPRTSNLNYGYSVRCIRD